MSNQPSPNPSGDITRDDLIEFFAYKFGDALRGRFGNELTNAAMEGVIREFLESQLYSLLPLVDRPFLSGGTRQPKIPKRQMEVWRLIAEGLTNQEIAGRLNITVSTVRTHIQELQFRLGSQSKAHLVGIYYAMYGNLVPGDPGPSDPEDTTWWGQSPSDQ